MKIASPDGMVLKKLPALCSTPAMEENPDLNHSIFMLDKSSILQSDNGYDRSNSVENFTIIAYY